MIFWKQCVYIAGAGFLLAVHFGCTAKVEADGGCKRSCSSRTIGGGKIRGLALTRDLTIGPCTPGSALGTFTGSFLVYDDTSTAVPSAADIPPRIPQAGIAFTPNIPFGATLVTPENEWCTDSCGVADVTFKATCVAQTSAIGIYVPGMLYDDKGALLGSAFVVTTP